MNTDIGILLYIVYGLMAVLLGMLGWEFLKVIYYIITFNIRKKENKNTKKKKYTYRK